MPSYYEFFAGGGMVRAGLGPGWRCLLANDIDAKKARAYAANWGAEELVCRDVAELGAPNLPGRADLAWASFPCQDLSLAGAGEGLGRPGSNHRTRSGTFWPFWGLIEALAKEGRAPPVVAWDAPAATARILDSMTAVNLAKVGRARTSGVRRVGTLYRRTRPNPDGGATPRWEVRFDDVAGRLRTPSGGSSRQKLLIVDGEEVRSRLITAREAARLMGLPDSYRLPERYSDAYHVAGDGVVAPVVRHLAATLIEPLVRTAGARGREAA